MELVPEWYKATKGAKTNTTSNSNPDGNSAGFSLTNRHSLSSCNREPSTSLSSKRWSSGSDGSARGSKNSSRAYSSFNRRERRKNLDPHDDGEKPLLADVGSRIYRNSSLSSNISGRTDRDSSWRSHSRVLDRHRDSERDSENVLLSAENASSGIRRAVSFKRDFPLLKGEERGETLGSKRVSSAILTRTLSAATLESGASTWKSALAEVPIGVVCNEVTHSSEVKSAPVSPVFSATSNSSGLNMAEALLQAPSRSRNDPKLSIDTSLANELTLRQCKQLIPKTPSMPKSAGLNSLEKPRFRGSARSGDFGGPPKSSKQFSSQLCLVNNSLEVPKAPQIGNLQALSREKAGIISSASKDTSGRDVSVKAPKKPNLKPELKDNKTSMWPLIKTSSSSSRDRKALLLSKDRNDFFNSIRNKSSTNYATDVVTEPSYSSDPGKSLSLAEQNARTCGDAYVPNQEKDNLDDNCGDGSVIKEEVNSENVALDDAFGHEDNSKDGMFGDASANNLVKDSGCSGVNFGVGTDAFYEEMHSQPPENFGENNHLSCSLESVDLEERAFLLSLGWNENAVEEGLTKEEISGFLAEYEKLRPCSKFSNRFDAVGCL